MTAAESQAIGLLNDHLKAFIEENRMAHQELKDFIKDVEHRLCQKIEQKDKRINEIIDHCRQREIKVDAILAERTVKIDAEIAAAKLEAVAEATRPSVYALATKGALEGFVRFATRAAVVIGLLSGFIALLKLVRVF